MVSVRTCHTEINEIIKKLLNSKNESKCKYQCFYINNKKRTLKFIVKLKRFWTK